MNKAATYFAGFKNYFSQRPTQIPATNQPTASMIPITSSTVPIAEYDYDAKKLTLSLIKQKDPSIRSTQYDHSWDNVISYQFSPQKKYLFINGTKLIDAFALKEINSFNGPCMTHEFSPDETSLIRATLQKETDGTLRYELFDIPSQKIIKLFKDVRRITYADADKLLIKYDTGTINDIAIKRNISLTPLQKMYNIFATQPITQSAIQVEEKATPRGTSLNSIWYDLENQKRLIIDTGTHVLKFNEPLSYSISPHKQYLLINQSSDKRTKTTLLDLQDGAATFIADNVITYEFSPDEKMLFILAAQKGFSTTDKPQYQIFLTDSSTISTPLENARSGYFTKTNKLILFDTQGQRTEIDTTAKPTKMPAIPADETPTTPPEATEKTQQTKEETLTPIPPLSSPFFTKTSPTAEPLTPTQPLRIAPEIRVESPQNIEQKREERLEPKKSLPTTTEVATESAATKKQQVVAQEPPKTQTSFQEYKQKTISVQHFDDNLNINKKWLDDAITAANNDLAVRTKEQARNLIEEELGEQLSAKLDFLDRRGEYEKQWESASNAIENALSRFQEK